ncbi:MAG: hypothetical protein ACJATA_001013 [Sphingobacteriales bacterium]|jgi:hypothetical protein
MSSATSSDINIKTVEINFTIRLNNNDIGKTSFLDFIFSRNSDILGLKLISKTITKGGINKLEFQMELCNPLSSNCEKIIQESYEVLSNFPEETFDITVVNPTGSPAAVLLKTKIKTNSKVQENNLTFN